MTRRDADKNNNESNGVFICAHLGMPFHLYSAHPPAFAADCPHYADHDYEDGHPFPGTLFRNSVKLSTVESPKAYHRPFSVEHQGICGTLLLLCPRHYILLLLSIRFVVFCLLGKFPPEIIWLFGAKAPEAVYKSSPSAHSMGFCVCVCVIGQGCGGSQKDIFNSKRRQGEFVRPEGENWNEMTSHRHSVP